MNTRRFVQITIVVILILALVPASVLAKGKPPPLVETTNNLSFPAIAVDGFVITDVVEAFTASYTGDHSGLTADQIAWLAANGPWYPQKTTVNKWNAQFASQSAEDVTYIDWGDNVESVSPKLRAPFRLEMTLYKHLDTPMTAYTMAVLEYPSSSSELQGTNNTTYAGSYATVISGSPKLVVQYLGASIPTDLTWNGTAWVKSDATIPSIVPVSFGPELNVGGKYIYGASKGGWKPTNQGNYRVTFYLPSGSGVNLALGTIANASTGFTPPTEGKAFAVLVPELNLTYIDLLATVGGSVPASAQSQSDVATSLTTITFIDPTLALTLNKEVSANGSTWSDNMGPVVVGTPLTYRYAVSSASNVSLAVDITDDAGTPAAASDDFTVCTVAVLQPGASAICTSAPVPAHFTGSDMSWTNLATAKGCVQTDCLSATDTASYSGQYWAFDPGFWKAHGPDAPSGNNAWSFTDYDTTQQLGEVFNSLCMTETPRGSKKPFAEYMLLEALAFKGGPDVKGAKGLLLRAAVASLLNASFHEKEQGGLLGPHGEVYFPYSTTQLVSRVDEALCWSDPATARQTMTHLMNELQNYNKGIAYIDWDNPANPPPLP